MSAIKRTKNGLHLQCSLSSKHRLRLTGRFKGTTTWTADTLFKYQLQIQRSLVLKVDPSLRHPLKLKRKRTNPTMIQDQTASAVNHYRESHRIAKCA